MKMIGSQMTAQSWTWYQEMAMTGMSSSG
jgi:hypothetical protein